MAYSAPPNFAAGQIVTEVQLDTLSDDITFLYSGQPSARAYNSANISIADNTTTALTFNSERWDNGTIHSTSVNTGRMTIATAGLYLITGHVRWAAGTGGNHGVSIRLNGTTVIAAQQFLLGTADSDLSIATVYSLAAADYVELLVYQNSGGAKNVLAAGNLSPEFAVQRIG